MPCRWGGISWWETARPLCCTPGHPFSVNYRGSSGFGQDCIDSLPGNVGTQDVQDIQVKVVRMIQNGLREEISRHEKLFADFYRPLYSLF